MEVAILDKEFQEKLEIQGLLTHSGWKKYKEQLMLLFNYESHKINQLLFCGKAVTADNLTELNASIAKLQCIKECMMIEKSLIELIETSPADGVQNESEEL